MTPQTKNTLCIAIATLLCTASLSAQTDFEKYKQQQQKEFADYVQQQQDNFKQYRDSLNLVYANYLEKEWQRFDLQKPKPLINKPVPEPPVYDNTTPKPKEEELPVAPPPPVKPAPEPKPQPQPTPPPTPAPAPQRYINSAFFGTKIGVREMVLSSPSLANVSEKEVAQYWKALTGMPYWEMVEEAKQLQTTLRLNDWGLYLLLQQLFAAYFPQGTANEEVIFSVFMLNQMGYRAKIGSENKELFALIAFEQEVSNAPFITYNKNKNIQYSVLNPKRRPLSGVKTCGIDYSDVLANMDLSLPVAPRFAPQIATKRLTVGSESYTLSYNQNAVNFYATYPCVDFAVYATTTLESTLQNSIKEQFRPLIAGKSQVEVVNFLLHFVQNAFAYKTDIEQFGYERWFFAEETVAAAYSDCEDRSILFTQLVRQLLNLPMVLVYYPGQHLATAVHFSDATVTGSYFMIEGKRYLICDPTYINATAGMAMPHLQKVEVELIEL